MCLFTLNIKAQCNHVQCSLIRTIKSQNSHIFQQQNQQQSYQNLDFYNNGNVSRPQQQNSNLKMIDEYCHINKINININSNNNINNNNNKQSQNIMINKNQKINDKIKQDKIDRLEKKGSSKNNSEQINSNIGQINNINRHITPNNGTTIINSNITPIVNNNNSSQSNRNIKSNIASYRVNVKQQNKTQDTNNINNMNSNINPTLQLINQSHLNNNNIKSIMNPHNPHNSHNIHSSQNINSLNISELQNQPYPTPLLNNLTHPNHQMNLPNMSQQQQYERINNQSLYKQNNYQQQQHKQKQVKTLALKLEMMNELVMNLVEKLTERNVLTNNQKFMFKQYINSINNTKI